MRVFAALPVLLTAPALGQFTHFETELVSVDRDIGGRITSTVRLYAALLDAGDQLNAVYGSNPNILTLDTTDPLGFYQHAVGADTAKGIAAALFAMFPDLEYDTWVALGTDNSIGSGLLQIGIDWGPWNSGGGVFTDNGGWLEIPFTPPTYPINGRVIIGQFTVSSGETVSGQVSMQGKDVNGGNWNAFDETFQVTVGGLGTSYCGPAVANSTGSPGEISATGSSMATGPLALQATHLPASQFGYFLASETQGFVANPGGSQGNLCLGGNIGRFVAQVGSTGSAGELVIVVDTSNIPTNPPQAILAGETWNFTCWYRDNNPGPTSNFTDGLSITFN